MKNHQATNQNPLISIIIPIYNNADFLGTCLKTVVNQTYQNLEIILIDDGSTDNSPEIIKTFAQKDPRVKVISQKNQGLSGARNAGLKKATGDFVTFIDSDDAIEPNMTETLFTSLKKHHADIAVCSFKEIYPNGKITHFNQNRPLKVYNTESALKAMLKEQGFMVSATMKLFPTKYFKNIEFPVGKLHEDIGTTYKLIMQAKTIVFVPDEFYLYYHHGNSIISQHFDNRKLDIITLTDQMCDDIDKSFPTLTNVTKERRIRARFSVLRQIPINNKHTKTIRQYLKNHQDYITRNPEASTIDKIALKIALTNLKLFQLAYKLFK